MSHTGIDHGVPYTAVAMLRDMARPAEARPLPKGYRFAVFTPEDEKAWVSLQALVTHVEDKAQGSAIFRQEFLQAPEDIPCEACPGYEKTVARTVLVKTDEGALVGAATLWDGDTFGETLPRVHWVAVHPDHQGRGLAKCMLARLLELYYDLGCRGPVYLTSQTKSYRAVRIYRQMGFAPYLGEKPADWPFRSDLPQATFRQENEAAWALIRRKLAEAGYVL